jgi:plasmid maintenance system antidote protein VapI
MSWKKHKLHLEEASAQGRTAEIFAEIKHTLGVPHVNKLFQALAPFPEFFDLFWRTAKPALETQEFFSYSDRLAAEAYTRMHNYFPALDLQRKILDLQNRIDLQSKMDLQSKIEVLELSGEIHNELRQVVELYHYNYPLLLLLCAALEQAFENPNSVQRTGTVPARHPVFVAGPATVAEELAPPPTRRIYDEMKRTLGTPFLSNSYLNLGRWPDFLKAYWDSLKPMLRTPLYEQHRLAVRDSAISFAAELPEPLQLSTNQMAEAGVPEKDINRIVQLKDLFLDLMSKEVLNIALAKIGLEDSMRSALAA